MLMNFSPLGLMNKPTYQTLDEVEIAKQIESISVHVIHRIFLSV